MIKEFKLWENDIPAYREGAECPNNVTAYIHEEGIHPAKAEILRSFIMKTAIMPLW